MSDDTRCDDPTDDLVPSRQCGRCRLRFPISADTHPWELNDWWLCLECRHALTPRRPEATTSAGDA